MLHSVSWERLHKGHGTSRGFAFAESLPSLLRKESHLVSSVSFVVDMARREISSFYLLMSMELILITTYLQLIVYL